VRGSTGSSGPEDARGIADTIPERRDQRANRARKGGHGGRPPSFDTDRDKQRNQAERLMSRRKQFRAVATRYDKLGVTNRPRC
jgi:hypothetical protein